jgi:parafibromin
MTDSDPLSLLRLSISQSTPPILSYTPDPASPSSTTPVSLSSASFLIFPSSAFPLSTQTRFRKSDGTSVDLRSIYFAWLHREDTIPDYITKAQNLGDGVVTNLAFLERLELVTWLEGGQEESEFIRPLPSTIPPTAATAVTSGGLAQQQGSQGSSSKVGPSSATLSGRTRQTDPRLLEIYSYERVVSNRNTFLRGIKPTVTFHPPLGFVPKLINQQDFSHVRKQAEDFITRLRNQKTPTTVPQPLATKSLPHRPGLPQPPTIGSATPSKPPSKSRSKDPIILLSPSASSLLSMANIKSFLESGLFTPSSSLPGPHPQIHHVSRLLGTIHPSLPMRFIVVDSPEKFKPDYWDRVVAVFTTGQAWQFRGYKWSNPVELFREVRGFYIGWEGEKVPDVVKGWGAGVRCLSVERARRFRDREVCEVIWEGIETSMRSKGWGSNR